MITVDGKWFSNIDEATEFAKIKSLAVGEDDDVRINIRTDKEPPSAIFPYDYELRIFHQGERVYFDDPARPNGYKKDCNHEH